MKIGPNSCFKQNRLMNKWIVEKNGPMKKNMD